MSLQVRLVAADVDLLRPLELGLGDLDILGKVDQHRAGTTGTGDIERLTDNARDVLGVTHQEAVLGDRPGDADHVHLLKGIVADQRGGHLAGDDHHRDRIHVGGGDAGHGVGGAGARSGDGHPHLTGCPGVAVGRMGAALLVAGQDMADLPHIH